VVLQLAVEFCWRHMAMAAAVGYWHPLRDCTGWLVAAGVPDIQQLTNK
jgi:hypothetical protein